MPYFRKPDQHQIPGPVAPGSATVRSTGPRGTFQLEHRTPLHPEQDGPLQMICLRRYRALSAGQDFPSAHHPPHSSLRSPGPASPSHAWTIAFAGCSASRRVRNRHAGTICTTNWLAPPPPHLPKHAMASSAPARTSVGDQRGDRHSSSRSRDPPRAGSFHFYPEIGVRVAGGASIERQVADRATPNQPRSQSSRTYRWPDLS